MHYRSQFTAFNVVRTVSYVGRDAFIKIQLMRLTYNIYIYILILQFTTYSFPH